MCEIRGEGQQDKVLVKWSLCVLKQVWFGSQGSQEKGLSPARGSAEAVGVVSRPGAGDVTAMEGCHRATRPNGPRRAERYTHLYFV